MTPALDGLDEAIRRLEVELEQLRAARETVAKYCGTGSLGHTLDPDPMPVRVPRTPIADGSLEHRILVACGEPVGLGAIVESAGARAPDVKRTVRALVEARRLKKTGDRAGTKYQRA